MPANFISVHVFLHLGTFGVEVLQLILALKLNELEQICKYEFSGKWLHPIEK